MNLKIVKGTAYEEGYIVCDSILDYIVLSVYNPGKLTVSRFPDHYSLSAISLCDLETFICRFDRWI